MHPDTPNRADDIQSEPGPTVQTVQSEPLFGTDPIAERHANDSSSMAPSRAAQPGIAARSLIMWTLLLLTLGGIAMMVFIAMHRHPADGGRVRGPGDEAAPNAPPDYKRR
jgi:hypothetical protein